MKRFVLGKFFPQYKTTIGSDFSSKNVLIDGNTVTLQVLFDLSELMQVWDTAGQERYQSLGVAFYKGAECCLLVCDLTKPLTFRSLSNWRAEFLRQAGPKNEERFPFVLLGNKADQTQERKVTREMAQQWCAQNGGVPYFETSAKEDTNVKDAFEMSAKLALKNQALLPY